MKKQLKYKLENNFNPEFLEIEDQSHLHVGHLSAPKGGNSHFSCTIVSEKFIGITSLKRHRLVYDALYNEMQQIHALSLNTFTPKEWEQNNA